MYFSRYIGRMKRLAYQEAVYKYCHFFVGSFLRLSTEIVVCLF